MEYEVTATESAKAAFAKLPEDWKKTMLEMYDMGCSDSEVMRKLKMTPTTFKLLFSDRLASDFGMVVEYGRILSRAWWERQGRIHIKERNFQTGLWSWNMQNRFGWSQRSTESKTDLDSDNKSDDEIREDIAALASKLGLDNPLRVTRKTND